MITLWHGPLLGGVGDAAQNKIDFQIFLLASSGEMKKGWLFKAELSLVLCDGETN